MSVMLRIFLWITAFVVALPFALGLWFWFISQSSVTVKKYDLVGGEQIIVKKEVFSAYDAKTTSISMDLRYSDGLINEVAKRDYGESEPDFSYGSFELRRNVTSHILRNDTTFYTRSADLKKQIGDSWKNEGDLRNSPELRAFALDLMPDVYGKLTKYSLNYPMPKYSVERWDSTRNVVVLLQPKQRPPAQRALGFNWKDYKYQSWLFQRWPRRLVFCNFQFDRQSTLALQKREQKS